MGVINKLSPHVSNLIAAGEVVERPASAVKELMENAIDAHADHITVILRSGGIASIQITDNGVGMTQDDARACFLRHATSKIATETDLSAISTLGFRGEALAAISAVSRIELITRTREDAIGTRVLVEAGEIISSEPWGAPVGTTIIVRDLFFNTPARMKFLKKDATEGMYAAAVIDRIALSHPDISVRYVKDGREVLHTPGDGILLNTIHTVLGKEFAETLVPVPESQSPYGFLLSGFVTKPEKSRPNRNMQYFFLNERSIKNRSLGAALEEAYRDSMMVGKFPGCILHLWVDPQRVDANVHPAKTEVKFADERGAFEAVYFAVKNAVTGLAHPAVIVPEHPVPLVSMPKGTEEKPKGTEYKQSEIKPQASSSHIPYEPVIQPKSTDSAVFSLWTDKPAGSMEKKTAKDIPTELRSPVFYDPTPKSAPKAEQIAFVPEGDLPDLTVKSEIPVTKSEPAKAAPDAEAVKDRVIPPYRILGDLFDSFIVVEVGSEVLFIDKHAAHERIIYNRLLKSESHSAPQLLLTPAVIPVSKEELARINENMDLLTEVGLGIEDFGLNTVIVRELPAHIDEDGIPALISEIASHLSKATGDRNTARDNILHTMACKAAVKAGRKSGDMELDRLVRDVLTLKDVRYCPHGRPVAVVMTKSDLEKNFKRI